MFSKSDDILKLAIAAAALIAGVCVGYYYVIYLPNRDMAAQLYERQKVEAALNRAAQERKAKETSAQARRSGYRTCVALASADYSYRWETTCKRKSEEATRDRERCVAGGLEEDYCSSLYRPVPSKGCALPTALADTYDRDVKAAKELCLEEAKTGVLE